MNNKNILWENINTFKFFSSGISNSNDFVYISNFSNVNEMKVHGYISEIEYVPNILSVNLVLEESGNNYFRYVIETNYAHEESGDSIFVTNYTGMGNSHDITKVFNVRGFLLTGILSSRTATTSLYLRYKDKEGIFTEWELIESFSYGNPLDYKSVNYKKTFDWLEPTKTTVVEIRSVGYAGDDTDIARSEFLFVPRIFSERTHKDKGKVHWFAFAS